jgi:methylglyoxal synthase
MTDRPEQSTDIAPTIALLADDSQVNALAEQVADYQGLLAKYHLWITPNLMSPLRQKLGPEQALSAGAALSAGGDLEIAADILKGNVAAAIALADYAATPYLPQLSTLVRACHLSNTPLALNPATTPNCTAGDRHHGETVWQCPDPHRDGIGRGSTAPSNQGAGSHDPAAEGGGGWRNHRHDAD